MPIYVAASGPLAAKLAGRTGDGFIVTSGKAPELYQELSAAMAEGALSVERDQVCGSHSCATNRC